MMMQSTSASPEDHRNHHHIMSEDQEQSIIINSTCPISWKLYHNPFFIPTNAGISNTNSLKLKPKQLQRKYSASAKFVHHLHSDLKMNSLSSSNSITSSDNNNNDCELNQARTQVAELKSELEMERKLRKKMEALNKKLSKELVDQVQKQRLCIFEDLTKEVSRLKDEMEKMKKEMEEERKMLRMAEVLREERVQMKLTDAHQFYHQKFLNQLLLQQQQQQLLQYPTSISSSSASASASASAFASAAEESRRLASSEHKYLNGTTTGCSSSFSGKNVNVQRKASPEPENPHIKQGIKGFVEFQRAIKAKNGSNYAANCNVGGSKQSRDVGSYNSLECQKAQLRVLFKQKCPPLPYSHHHDHLILS